MFTRAILKSLAILTVFVAGVHSATAASVLTFEGLKDSESINNYYNGGTGGSGSTGGTNYGVSFTSDSLSLISTASGGNGNFSNNPSGKTILFFSTGAGDTMNVAAGFNTGFSFFYANGGAAGSVNVFSGLNGTGTLLSTLVLAPTSSPYTVWAPIGVNFAGSAKSVLFAGAANFIGFDDITLGSPTAGSTASSVPDAGTTLALMGVSVFALGLLKRKLA